MTQKNSRKLKKIKEKKNGQKKERMGNLQEIQRTKIHTTHGDGQAKKDMKGSMKALVCNAERSLYEFTISSAILTNLVSYPFVGCVVQDMRLYLK